MSSTSGFVATDYAPGGQIVPGRGFWSIETSQGRFVFDESDGQDDRLPRPFGVSSQMKWPYRGTFFACGKCGEGVPAVALFYAQENWVGLQRECEGLAHGRFIGMGPQWSVHATGRRPDDPESPVMQVVIVEDAGISLREALDGATIPGVSPTVLDADATSDIGSRQTAKLEYDLASQVLRLHASGFEHGDIKAKNVCVRSIGHQPWDLRATVIDLDLLTPQGGDIGRLGNTPPYFNALFIEKPAAPNGMPEKNPSRVDYDLGCLALVFCEIEHRKSITDLDDDELSSAFCGDAPLFWYDDEGKHHASDENAMLHLKSLACGAGLRTFGSYRESEPYLKDAPLWLRVMPSYLQGADYLDKQDLRVLRGNYLPDFVQYEEVIALRIFQNYNEQLKADGEQVKYPDFDSAPASVQKSNYDQAASYVAKVALMGCAIARAQDCPPSERIRALSESQVEILARDEHERWMAERIADGWVYGETADSRGDFSQKTSPWLIPYDELPERIKEYDRSPARNLIPVLEAAGLAVRRSQIIPD